MKKEQEPQELTAAAVKNDELSDEEVSQRELEHKLQDLKTFSGYHVNEARTAIMSMHTVVRASEKPQHFIESENMDDKVLHIVDGGTRIEAIKSEKLSDEEAAQRELERKQSAVRAKRNTLIAETDYLVMPDYPISPDELTKVKEYRQALRDVTEQASFAEAGEVEWPTKPQA